MTPRVPPYRVALTLAACALPQAPAAHAVTRQPPTTTTASRPTRSTLAARRRRGVQARALRARRQRLDARWSDCAEAVLVVDSQCCGHGAVASSSSRSASSRTSPSGTRSTRTATTATTPAATMTFRPLSGSSRIDNVRKSRTCSPSAPDILRDYPGARSSRQRPTPRGRQTGQSLTERTESQRRRSVKVRGDPRARRHPRLRAAASARTASRSGLGTRPRAHRRRQHRVLREGERPAHGRPLQQRVIPFVDVKAGGSQPPGYASALDRGHRPRPAGRDRASRATAT